MPNDRWVARAGVLGIPVTPTPELLGWRPGRGTAGAAAALIAAADVTRTGLVIENLDDPATGAAIFLGPDNTVTPATGFPLLPGASITFGHQADVYGITAGTAIDWATAEEFIVP